MSQSARLLLPTSCLLASFFLAPHEARAENKKTEGAIAWGMLATEAATVGVVALSIKADWWPSESPGIMLNTAPLILGPALAYAGWVGDFDPRPAYAIHGAATLGTNLFLIGSLFGDDDGDVGMHAWALGAAGTAAGAWIGATQIDNTDEGIGLYVGPVSGFGVGGIVGMATSLLTGNTDDFSEYAGYGAVAGMTLGVAGSLLFAFVDKDGERESSSSVAPKLTTNIERTLVSFGGAF